MNFENLRVIIKQYKVLKINSCHMRDHEKNLNRYQKVNSFFLASNIFPSVDHYEVPVDWDVLLISKLDGLNIFRCPRDNHFAEVNRRLRECDPRWQAFTTNFGELSDTRQSAKVTYPLEDILCVT